ALAENSTGGPSVIIRGLEHLGALLCADDDQRLWHPLVNAALYRFSDRLTDLGRLGDVKLNLEAGSGWVDRVPREKAREPVWQRERSVLLGRQGDVLQGQGDLAGALAAYRECLQSFQRLAGIDPSSANRQDDLSETHNHVGDALWGQGDLAGALA